MLTIDFLLYLSHLKYILKIEKNTSALPKTNLLSLTNLIIYMIIYNSENTNMHAYYLYYYICMYGRNHCNQAFTFLKDSNL